MKKRCESARLESIITLPGLSPPRTIRRYIRSTTSQMDRRFTVAASDTSIGRTVQNTSEGVARPDIIIRPTAWPYGLRSPGGRHD